MTEQSKTWEGTFGKDYTERNPQNIEELDKLYSDNFGITRTALNQEFLASLPRDITILEVGSNIGAQLTGLQKMGFQNLTGMDVLRFAVEKAKKNISDIDFIKASALDIPFKDNSFDFVFTSGVLIHIHPNDINKVIEEIYRVSKSYIWGFEYFSEDTQEIEYRGNKNLLWKSNFMKLFLDKFPDLKIIKEKKVNYLKDKNTDHMFLLKK